MQTNATLLTPSRVAWIKKNFAGIGTSLDGPPEIHVRMRGKGNAQRVIEAINLFREQAMPIGEIVVLHEGDIGQTPRIMEFFNESGINLFQANVMTCLGRARDTPAMTRRCCCMDMPQC